MQNLPTEAWFADLIDTGKKFFSMKIFNRRVGVRVEKTLYVIGIKNFQYFKFKYSANYVKLLFQKMERRFISKKKLCSKKWIMKHKKRKKECLQNIYSRKDCSGQLLYAQHIAKTCKSLLLWPWNIVYYYNPYDGISFCLRDIGKGDENKHTYTKKKHRSFCWSVH